jgi:hypothetical protein
MFLDSGGAPTRCCCDSAGAATTTIALAPNSALRNEIENDCFMMSPP